MDTVCDILLLLPVEKKQFGVKPPWFVSLRVKLQLSAITSIDVARGFVNRDLLISNYNFNK